MSRISQTLLSSWKLLSTALFGPSCRFVPTCSEYAVQAVKRRGIIQGGYLALKRICRCNSLFPGGFDPLPPENLASDASFCEATPTAKHKRATDTGNG